VTPCDPAEVRKAVEEFTPRRPQKFQVVEKSLPAVTNARIVPLRSPSRALVTSLHFQHSNNSGGLPSVLGGGHCAPLADRRQNYRIRINRPGAEFVNQWLSNSDFPIADWKIGAIRYGYRWASFLVYKW
jgi:hypothetical protein